MQVHPTLGRVSSKQKDLVLGMLQNNMQTGSTLHQQIPGCVAGIRELTQRLQERGTAVYLVSGGFRSIINPIADMLNIPRDHVYANTIVYKVCCLHSSMSVPQVSNKQHPLCRGHKGILIL